MAYGSNDKRGSNNNNNNNNSTQQDNQGNNHHIVTVSTPCLTTTTSLPNNPRPTPSHFPQSSGTIHSFNNYDDGLQDFSRATINCGGIGDSFNNHSSGSQSFKSAEILSANKSSKQSKSIFPWTRHHVPHYPTLHSFNNKGKGSQSFDGFKLNN